MMKLISFSINGNPISIPSKLPQPGKAPSIISNAITIFITAGIIAAIITIIWAGIQWTTSGGDKQKLASAKARLTWGIIGLIIILISFFIINIWGYFFGVNLLNVSF
jgi:hypothetical protein